MLNVVPILCQIGTTHGESSERRHLSTRQFADIVQIPFDNGTVHFLGVLKLKDFQCELGVTGISFILRTTRLRPSNVPAQNTDLSRVLVLSALCLLLVLLLKAPFEEVLALII